ncbi:hypothetical protein KEM55_005924 [Ascosphaera atra]|nr:hypothetical protein KEM55_005924 [Ascosphaera atra]
MRALMNPLLEDLVVFRGAIPQAYMELLQVLMHNCKHWSAMVGDTMPVSPEKLEQGHYFHRSELATVFAIFWDQMHDITLSNDANENWTRAKFSYTPEKVPMATVVNFWRDTIRIVQATCDPSTRSLSIILRASWHISEESYNKVAMQKAVKWIISPPDPLRTQDLARRDRAQARADRYK